MLKFSNVKFRTKLLIFVLLAIFVVLLASIYMYFSLQILIKDTTVMYERAMELTAVYRQMSLIQQEIQFYLSTNSSDSLIAFYDYMNVIKGLADNLLKNVSYTSEGIKSKNAANMILNYLDNAESAIMAKRGRDIDGYMAYYALTVEKNSDIMRYIEEIMSGELINTSDSYAIMSKRIQIATRFNNKPGKNEDNSDKPGKGNNNDNKPGKGSDNNNKSSKGNDNFNESGKENDNSVKPGKGNDKKVNPNKENKNDDKPESKDKKVNPGKESDNSDKPGKGKEKNNKQGNENNNSDKPDKGNDKTVNPNKGNNNSNKPDKGNDKKVIIRSVQSEQQQRQTR
jgi:hypothetical protein